MSVGGDHKSSVQSAESETCQQSVGWRQQRNHQNCVGNVSHHFIVFFLYFHHSNGKIEPFTNVFHLRFISNKQKGKKKEKKKVSDLFPKPSAAGKYKVKGATSSSLQSHAPFSYPLNISHLALAPPTIPGFLFIPLLF